MIFFCPDFRNCRVSAEFKNSLWYKKEAVGFTLDPKGFSVQRSEYVLKQCVNGFKYCSEVCYKMGGTEGGRGNWEDPRRAKSYSQVVEIHQNEKAKLVFRWQERQEKSHANSRTWTEQLESSHCRLPGEFLKTCSWLVIYGRRAGGRKKKRLKFQG